MREHRLWLGMSLVLWYLGSGVAYAGGGGPTVGISGVTSSAETEVGATGGREGVSENDLTEYEHELERITPATEEGEEDSREFATQTSRVQASATSLQMSSRGEALLEAPRHVGLGITSFSLSFNSDVPVTVTFSASVSVEAPGSGGSTDAEASFNCGCDPEEDDPDECNVEDAELEVGDSPGLARSGSISRSGRAIGGCSIFLFANTSLGEDQATARARWTATLSVTTETAPEQGTVFRYVGPAQGSFGDEGSWEDENGLAGVPGFRSFEDADTAIVEGEGFVTMDLGGGLSRGTRGPGVERRTGRKQIRSTQTLRPIGGTLILDSLEPGLADRSLEIGNAKLLLDQGGVQARHVIVGLGGDGELEVAGPDGFFTTEGRFGLGGNRDGRVSIKNGAQVTSAETVLGEVDGQGSAVVEGAGTLWQTGNLAVGLADDAALAIESGARVESERSFVDCQLAAGPGVPGCAGLAGEEKAEVTIQGAASGTPSTWALTGDLEIGARGKVSVANGAALEAFVVEVGTSGNDADCIAGLACLDVTDGRVTADGVKVGTAGDGKLQIGPAGRVTGAFGVSAGAGELSDGQIRLLGPSAEAQLVTTDTGLALGLAFDARGVLSLESGARASLAGTSLVGASEGASGLIELLSDSVLRIAGPSASLELGRDVVGTVTEVTGELLLSNARLELADADLEVRRTGRASGTGRIDGSGAGGVVNNGVIGCGVLVNSIYVQGPDGVLECPQASLAPPPQLNPLAASRFLRAARKKPAPVPPPRGPFVVTGDATLDGTLALAFLNGFAPSLGDSFEILDVSGVATGGFANVAVTGLAPGSFGFASDLVDGKLTLTSETDAVALPPISLKGKPKLKETKKAGLKLKVKRSGDLSAPLSVAYRLGGSAKNGVDYAQLPLAVEIPAGKRSASVAFRPVADGLEEGTETIELELLPGDGYSLPFVPTLAVELSDAKPKGR